MSQTYNVFSNVDKNRRSSNFSTKEVQFLIQLVDKKKEIVESKKTDRITSDEKVKAWLEIEEEFNEVFDEYRSLKVLKTKYENLKKNVKKQVPANVSNTELLKIMQSNEHMGKIGNEPTSDNEYTAKKTYNIKNAIEILTQNFVISPEIFSITVQQNTDTVDFIIEIKDDDETEQNSNETTNYDTKPQTVLNNDNGCVNSTAEQCAFETLLLGEAQSSPKISKSQTTVQTTEKRKKPLDIWDEVAYKKIKKLNLEMSILDEEWKLRKTKLELELENERSENKLKEDKLKLEIELLKQKLESKSFPENF